MCGIAGLWGTIDSETVTAMMELMRHRGPDDKGVSICKSGVIGHRRLSIMDLGGGHQPIYNESGSASIVANGEIYNYPGLKEKLASRHKFQTGSDTEAILHLFEEESEKFANQLDGMYAFAISDKSGLFLARDPIGIKPLYYAKRRLEDSDEFYFASELKALTDIDAEVREFPPGTLYHTSTGFMPYFDMPDNSPSRATIDEACSLIRMTIEEAVVKRLMSDAPLGAFLSGGLDSSIIAAITARHVNELHTFSVGIEGSHDLQAARTVARHIGSIHHEYIFTAKEVLEKLQNIIYHLESYDQDLVRSAIPCYFCSRLASDYVKVILTGEGADELFAGYTYYKSIDDSASLHSELRRSVSALHNINLQRVDRMTMAHGIEGRVPFLDLEVIELAQKIAPNLKLYTTASGRRIEKWILRKAFEDMLPSEIVWREKEQFDEGSGTVDMLDSLIESTAETTELRKYINSYSNDRLRSLEEAYYHKLLIDSYIKPKAIIANTARWHERPTQLEHHDQGLDKEGSSSDQ